MAAVGGGEKRGRGVDNEERGHKEKGRVVDL
jgi:hypothetical protein